MPEFAGFVYTAAGAGNSGLTVNLYARNGTSSAVATTTTNSDGAWTISHGTEGRYDVEIVVDDNNKFRIKYDDKIQCELGEFGELYVRGTNDAFTTKFASTPTASRTITFPDATATALLGGYANTNSGVMSFTSTANSAAAVYLRENGGTSGTIKIHADQGTSVTEGAESINILSDLGGVGIRSTANLAKAINITSDGGTTGSIAIFNDQGTSVTEGAESISILSDAGGVGIRSTANLANAVNITVDGGTTSTMTLFNDQGTAATEGAASIQLLSDVGGINIKSGLNAADAILLTADGGTSEKIRIHADQGTGVDSIELTSDAGGIELNVASGVGITGNAIKDEDNMSSNSAVHIATQQSIKAYVDAQIATEDTIAELNDTNISSPAAGHLLIYDNTASVWDNAALSGGTGLTATLGDGTLALAIDSTVATLSGSQTLTNKSITAPTITGAVGGTQDSATITALTISSMAGNWTNASRTVADMGTVTTIDINGGTIDGTVIGGTTTAAGSFAAVAGTTGTFSSNVSVGGNLTVNGTTTTVDTATLAVVDPIIHLQTASDGGALGSDTNKDVGLALQYHTGSAAKQAFLGIDDSDSYKLMFIPDASLSSEVVSGSVGTIKANLEGTADTATVATTVTITDNENTNEDNAIIFTAGGDVDGGNIGLESDGTLTYNPSTGKVTATGFIGTLTGNVTGDVTGNVTGNTSGTAATVTGATQSAITAVGTLGSIDIDGGAIDGVTLGTNAAVTQAVIDNININGTTIGHTSDTDLLTLTSANLAVAGDIEVSGSHSLEVATIDYTDGDLAMTIADGGGVTFAQDITTTSHMDVNFVENSSAVWTDPIGDNTIDEHTAQGVIMTFKAGSNVTAFSPVYLHTDNEVHECDADEIAKMPCIGVSINTGTIADGEDIQVCLLGLVRDDSFAFGTAGAPVYVSTTVGEMTNTAPSGEDDVVQIVGHSIGDDAIFVQPCLTTIEHTG